MPKVNGRFLGILVVTFAVLAGGVYATHTYQVGRQTRLLREQAVAAAERDDAEDAIATYRQYLGLAKDDHVTREEFGDYMRRIGQIREAYRLYDRAAAARGDDLELAKKLTEVALDLQRFDDALRVSQTTLLAAEPADPESLTLAARAHLGLREFDEAAEKLRQAVESGRADVTASTIYARLTAARDADIPAGLTTLDRLVESSPDDAEALIARGRYSLDVARGRIATFLGNDDTANEDDSAETVVDGSEDAGPVTERDEPIPVDRRQALAAATADAFRAISLAPENTDAIRLGIETTFLSGDYAKLLELTTRAIEAFPEDVMFYESRAEALLRTGKTEEAIATLRSGIEATSSTWRLRWTLTTLLIDAGRFDDAEQELPELEQAEPPDALLGYARGRIAASRGEWQRAIDLLQGCRDGLIRNRRYAELADYQLAICFRELGDDDRRIASLRRVLTNNPLAVSARKELAIAFVDVGRADLASDELTLALALGGNDARSLLTLAAFEIVDNLRQDEDARRWERVDQILTQLDRLVREGIRAATEEGPDAAGAVPDVTAARRLLADATVLRAEAVSARGQIEEALTLLATATDEWPESEELAILRALFESRAGNHGTAETLLTDIEANFEGSVRLRHARAVCLTERAEQDRGTFPTAEIVAFARPPAEGNETTAAESAAVFYRILSRAGAAEAAVDAARRVADARPTDLTPRMFLLDRAAEANDAETLHALAEEIREINGDGGEYEYAAALADVVTARQTAASGRLPAEVMSDAQDRLGRAALKRPHWHAIPSLSARLHQEAGDAEAALGRFAEAFELGERDPEVVAELLVMLEDRGRYAEADAVVRRLRSDRVPVSDALKRVAIERSPQRSDYDRAGRLTGLGAVDTDDVGDLLWLGHVHAILGDTVAADEAFAEALTRAPGDRRTRIGRLRFLAAAGRTEEAEAALEAWAAPGDEIFTAEGHAVLGRPDRAVELVLNTEPDGPDDVTHALRVLRAAGRTDVVETYLVRRLNDAVRPAMRRKLRRELALKITEDGDPTRVVRAQGLIEENQIPDADGGVPREDIRAKAIVLAGSPETGAEALRLMKQLIADGYDPSASDRTLIARLELKYGERVEGIDKTRGLFAAGVRIDPDDALAYTRGLVDGGEIDEARLWIDRLWEGPVSASKLARLAAEIEFYLGRHAPLCTELDTGLGTIGERLEPDARLALLARFSEALERDDRKEIAGFYKQAGLRVGARLWTRGGEFTPAQAEMLIRAGRPTDAIDQLEQSAEKVAPTALLIIVERILNAPGVSEDEFDRLDRLIGRLAENLPQGVQVPQLFIARAQIADRAGRFDRAIEFYEEAAVLDPENPVVANNSAVLLALSGRNPGLASVRADKAISLAGPIPALLDTKGVALIAAGRPKDAFPYLQQVVSTGQLPIGAFHLAWALTDLNATSEARKVFVKAIEDGLTVDDAHMLERDKFEELRSLLIEEEL
ncbi:MAG: tetratricopeptide repeat protein [Planctomycetota bacterium]